MSFVTTIDHAYALIAQDAVKAEKALAAGAGKVADELRKAAVAEPVIESITQILVTASTGNAALGISAVNIERLAFACAGTLLALATDTSAAAQEQFKNVVKDAQLANDIRAAAPVLLAKVKASGLLSK
jgi:hypothetical protein